MPHGQHTTTEIIARLEVLWDKLENEGCYTRANTVAFGIQEIQRLLSERDAAGRSIAALHLQIDHLMSLIPAS